MARHTLRMVSFRSLSLNANEARAEGSDHEWIFESRRHAFVDIHQRNSTRPIDSDLDVSSLASRILGLERVTIHFTELGLWFVWNYSSYSFVCLCCRHWRIIIWTYISIFYSVERWMGIEQASERSQILNCVNWREDRFSSSIRWNSIRMHNIQYPDLLTFPRQMAVIVCAGNEAYSVLSSVIRAEKILALAEWEEN